MSIGKILTSLKDTIKQDAPGAVRLYNQVWRSAQDIKSAALGDRANVLINDIAKKHTGMRVQSGPFAGMQLVDRYTWGNGCVTAKLLGVYEQELHAALSLFAKKQYGAIADIGCAEGYYAVGAARLFPNTPVYAFDLSPAALATTEEAGVKNGVADQIRLSGVCSPVSLLNLASEHTPLLVISDCEGYELELFNPEVGNALRESDLIIECHDFAYPGCTDRLVEILSNTHHVEILQAGGRNPNIFPLLSKFSDIERWEAICEHRPCVMSWLICEGRRGGA